MKFLQTLLFFARPTRSQHPPPVKGDTTRSSSAIATADDSPLAALRAVIVALMLRVVMKLSHDERAFLTRDLDGASALNLGAVTNARDVVDECVRCLSLAMPWVLLGRLGDFGPPNARLMLEDLHDILPAIAAHAAIDEAAAATVVSAPAETLKPWQRTNARRSLNKLTRKSAAFDATLASAEASQPAAGEPARRRARTLVQIAFVRAHVPPRIREGVGLAAETLDALEASVKREVAGTTARRERRTQKHAMRSDLALSVGRLVLQLRQLVFAARAQHAIDATSPVISSIYVPAHKAATRPAATAPATTNATTPAIPPTH